MSDVLGIGKAASAGISAASAIYIADQQNKIARAYSNRAEEIHLLTLARGKDDLSVWQTYARQCLIDQVKADCAEALQEPQFDEATSRAAVAIRLGVGKAKKQIQECGTQFCIGATCHQTSQLDLQAGIALADAANYARGREDARVRLLNQSIRQNKLNSVAVVRGNYNSAQSGLEALSKMYQQTAANASQGAAASFATAANLLGRAFGPNPTDYNRPFNQPNAPIEDRSSYAPTQAFVGPPDSAMQTITPSTAPPVPVGFEYQTEVTTSPANLPDGSLYWP